MGRQESVHRQKEWPWVSFKRHKDAETHDPFVTRLLSSNRRPIKEKINTAHDRGLLRQAEAFSVLCALCHWIFSWVVCRHEAFGRNAPRASRALKIGKT